MCRACAATAASPLNGLTKHPLYDRLMNMRARCENERSPDYRYYGARGITVCAEWRNDPVAFVAWAEANGYSPALELDRIDNDGPYSPGNCQWITHAENSRKRSNARCDEGRARAIKSELAIGRSLKSIAIAYGVTDQIVRSIKKGETWRDV
jgi:hypothetical protein